MKRETTSERKRGKRRRKNYVRENVIECKHTSKHICVNSLVNITLVCRGIVQSV